MRAWTLCDKCGSPYPEHHPPDCPGKHGIKIAHVINSSVIPVEEDSDAKKP